MEKEKEKEDTALMVLQVWNLDKMYLPASSDAIQIASFVENDDNTKGKNSSLDWAKYIC